MPLNAQRKRFVEELVRLGNQTQAYMAAYPKCKNVGTARSNAYRLLTDADVSAYRDELLARNESKRIANANEVLTFLTSAMRGEIKDSFDLDPSLCDRLDAAKQLAKRYGLDKAVSDIDRQINIRILDGEEDGD